MKESGKDAYVCLRGCQKSFQTPAGRSKHHKKAHPDSHEVSKGSKTIAVHRCEKCPRMFGSYSSLRSHRSRVHALRSCPLVVPQVVPQVEPKKDNTATPEDVKKINQNQLIKVRDNVATPEPPSKSSLPLPPAPKTSMIAPIRPMTLSRPPVAPVGMNARQMKLLGIRK